MYFFFSAKFGQSHVKLNVRKTIFCQIKVISALTALVVISTLSLSHSCVISSGDT